MNVTARIDTYRRELVLVLLAASQELWSNADNNNKVL